MLWCPVLKRRKKNGKNIFTYVVLSCIGIIIVKAQQWGCIVSDCIYNFNAIVKEGPGQLAQIVTAIYQTWVIGLMPV